MKCAWPMISDEPVEPCPKMPSYTNCLITGSVVCEEHRCRCSKIIKLFVITRADLSSGQQAVQGMHALVEFEREHPGTADWWYTASNTLAFLTVPHERELQLLLLKARQHKVPAIPFHEPDRKNQMTGIVIGPTGHHLTAGLAPALKEVRKTG